MFIYAGVWADRCTCVEGLASSQARVSCFVAYDKVGIVKAKCYATGAHSFYPLGSGAGVARLVSLGSLTCVVRVELMGRRPVWGPSARTWAVLSRVSGGERSEGVSMAVGPLWTRGYSFDLL